MCYSLVSTGMFVLKRNIPQLAATGIKGISIQLRLVSDLPGSIFMRRRLGCHAACCIWVRRRRFTLTDRLRNDKSLPYILFMRERSDSSTNPYSSLPIN